MKNVCFRENSRSVNPLCPSQIFVATVSWALEFADPNLTACLSPSRLPIPSVALAKEFMALRQIYHHHDAGLHSSSSSFVGASIPRLFKLSPALPLPRPPRCELGGGGGSEEERRKDAEKGRRKEGVTLDDVNPVGLGRRSRQIFDEVWRKFSGLGQISRSRTDEDDSILLIRGPMCEFTVPEAQDTTVLVVGATSRIGRIVARKLMLRGYKVKVR